MKLNEFGTNDVRGVNYYGSAAIQRKQNQLAGNADANLTTKETLGKNIFVNKFIEKATTGLDNALKSGAISATAPVQPTTPASSSSPTSPSPEEIRKQKQAAAISAINAKPTSNQPTQPSQATQFTAATKPSATTMPATNQPAQQKIDPKKAAELKGRLSAGQGLGSKTGGGFQNYVAGSGERMTGVDASKAPIFKKIAREDYQIESKYDKLNAIFESILNEQSPTISSFILDAWKAYLHGVNLSDPQLMAKAQALANQVQATYAKDKGRAALNQLADLAWYASSASAVATGQNKVNDDDDDDNYGAGTQSNLGNIQGTGTMRQAYGQIRKILDKLGKNERAELITALQNTEEKANI